MFRILSLPLTLIPLAIYNMAAFGFFGTPAGDPWFQPMLTVELVSGARFSLVSGDLMILCGLVVLFLEILKATRTGTAALADHIFSMLVFAVYLVEFLTVPLAASSVFFILTVISLIDVIAGFTVSLTGARRDVSFGGRE
ncbi:hypothetical protein [Pannonibacter phragmitetus]|uniref:hypothetical protein n=1 Tax=Pannonibacter phragmitetus TaxID=121719 RepID=UPI003D2F1476